MTEPSASNVTADFIFGTLATDELRLAELRARTKGIWHGGRIAPMDPEPGETIALTVNAGSDVDVATIDILFTIDGSWPTDTSAHVPMQREGVEWDTLAWCYLERWTAELALPDEPTLVRYVVRTTLASGELAWADTPPGAARPQLFAVAADRDPIAPWLRTAEIYHVFVDRFAPEHSDRFDKQSTLNDVWGGTLNGVTRHLDHIAHLGANGVWLSPIFPSPSHHGYDATDYTSIEPRLGTIDDFDRLVRAAHERGIRVILDFVANHVSDQHPAFRAAVANAAAPERAWFTFGQDGSYDSFFGVREMPRIAVDHDAAGDYLIDSALFWVRHGVDGFRLDYANGPSHAFWARFRRELRAERTDVALVGEVVESADTMRSYAGRLDGTLDFLMLQAMRAFLAFDAMDAPSFWRFVERHYAYFGDAVVLPSFLDNHDMNRFLWIVRGDVRRLKLAALIQHVLPGPPIVYYGTEVGLSQWHDLEYPDGSRRMEESRTPMLWGPEQDTDVLEFYRSLIYWRTSYRIGREVPVGAHASGGVLVLQHGPWLIVVNRSEDEEAIDTGMPGSTWLALATGNDVRLHGGVVVLPAMSGAILSTGAPKR